MNNELRKILKYEKEKNIRNMSAIHIIKLILTSDPTWLRYKFIKYMRLANHYGNNTVLGLFYLRKKNKLSLLLNLEISGRNIGPGLTLYHNGPVVINGDAVIGKDLVLHGDNCIGNDGKTDECPVIGDNVDVGVGAKIIGNVKIADNVVIGAGAVVVKDIIIPGTVVGGVPSKILKVGISDAR